MKWRSLLKDSIQKRMRRLSTGQEVNGLLELYRQADPAENEGTSPPEDERIDLQCVWGVEFYTPSHMEKLYENIQRLDWDNDKLEIREELTAWVQSTRLNGFDAWTTIGVVGPNGGEGFNRTAPLPSHVEVMRGIIYTHNTSLTCVAICFEFKDRFKGEYDRSLREPRQTYTEASPGGQRIFRPMSQKVESINQIRHDLAIMVAKWFRENLPGVFSSEPSDGGPPICEFVRLRSAEPFPSSAGPYYLRSLRMDSAPGIWQSETVPGLKFASQLLDSPLQHHSVVAIKDEDSTISTEYVDDTCRELIAKWAILPLLDFYRQRLSRLRDDFTSGVSRRLHPSPDRILRSVVDNVSHQLDIVTITDDLISSTEGPAEFQRSIPKYSPSPGTWIQDTFARFLCSAVNKEAKELRRTNDSLRDHFSQYGSLLAARESNRLQSRVYLLSAAVLVLALVNTCAALFPTEIRDCLLRFWPF